MNAHAKPGTALERATLRAAELPVSDARMELLEARYLVHRFTPHWHAEYAVGVVESGALRARIGRQTVVATAGQVVVIEPGVVHTGEPAASEGYAYRMMYVPASVMTLFARDAAELSSAGAPPAFGRPVIDDPALAGELCRAHTALMSRDADRLAAEDGLAAALGDLSARFATGARPHDRRAHPRLARLVRDYLEENHSRVVTLAELSRLTGRNPFYLSRTFRNAYDVPPYAYLALVRVHRARELLAGGQSPSMVAHIAGFSDQSHFNRQFKRVFGVTPGQYSQVVARAAGRARVFSRSAGAR